MSQTAAEAAVKTGLGISLSADLSADPILGSDTGLYSAGVNVATLMIAAGGGSDGAIASEALANALKTASSALDLADVDVVSSILSSTNLPDLESVALIVSDQAAALSGASSIEDVANVQALTFVVSENSGVISFSGTATGNIVVTMNSTGGATFSRAGVDGKDNSGDEITIANIGTKEINYAGELSVVVTGASTSGDDSHVINAPDATKITLRGSMGDGNNEVRIKIADDTPGTAETRTLEIISDGFTVGDLDRLVFDFAGEEDLVSLSVDSEIAQFKTIEVAKGTADLRSVDINPDTSFVVNSEVTLTQAQFLSVSSVVSASGLGQVNLTLDSGQTLATLNTSIAARSDDFVLVGTDLLIKDSTGNTVLTTTDGVATGGTTIPAAISSASYKGIPELTTHISTSISNLETQLVNGASTPFNSLGEVETYITGLNTLITNLTTLIGDSDGELTGIETSLIARLNVLEASIAGDSTAPSLTSIAISGASGNNGSYLNAGDIVTISATFDSNVLVTGTPYAQIVVGSVYQYAAYSSGAGTNVLNFNYTVDDREAPSGIAIASGSIEHRDGSTITDIAGNTAIITNSYVNADSSYIVDLTAPTAVTITSSADDTSDTTPTITMTADTGSTVKVIANGVELGTATEGTGGSAGTFTFTSSALSDGNYSIVATSTDTAGNVTSSTAQELVIDTVIPNVPTITSASTGVTATPTITGTAEVGSTVTVVFAGATYSTTATNGTWSIVVGSTSIASGSLSINANGGNSVSVTAADAAGNTSVAATQTLTIDTTAPTVGASTDKADGSYTVGEEINITLTFSENVTLAGTNGLNVTLNTGDVINITAAELNGVSTVTKEYTVGASDTSADLAISGVALGSSATLTDAAGNSIASSISLTSNIGTSDAIVIDTTAPGAVSITSSADDTSDTTPTITMTADTGSTVKVIANGVELGTATEGTGGSAGTFTFTSSALSDGNYSIVATSTDTAGNVTSSTAQELVIDTVIPNVPTITSASTGVTATPTITGTAEVGSTVTVVFAGATYSTTATNGTWSIVVGSTSIASGSLSINANGGNSVSVTAADAAGNTSVAATQTLTIDTTAPTVGASTDKADGSYTVGEEINITLTFSENVTLAGTNGLNVTLNTGDVINITAAELNGVSTVTKEYTVGASDTSADLAISGVALGSSATLTDAAGNSIASSISLTSNIGTSDAIVIDTTAPGAASSGAVDTSNDFSANSVLAAGETITLTFAEGVNVSSFILGTQFSPSALSAVDEAKLGTGYSVAKVGSEATATQFIITLGAGSGLDSLISAVKSDRTLTFSKDVIIDSTGNNASDNIALTSGIITSDISTIITNKADIAAHEIVTVTDAVNMVQYTQINAVTDVDIILTGGIADDVSNLAADDTNGTIDSVFDAATTQDTNVAVTVAGTATVAQAYTIAEASTGVIQFTNGITDEAAAMSNSAGTIETKFNAVKTDDPDVAVTVTNILNVNQAETIAEATTGTVNFAHVDGITDTALKLADVNGDVTDELDAATAPGGDADTAITVTTVANVAQAQTISGKSTGEIDFSAGIKDVAAAMSDASGGITTPFNNATQDDTDAQIIVEDVVNVEQAKTIAEASSGAIDFRLGIEDAAGDLAAIGGAIDASLTAATAT